MFVPRIAPVSAIVLRALPWREKDRLLILFTKERGKVFALAQGSQIPQNRLAPATQTGIIATFWLAKAREFDRITDYRIERFLTRMRRDVFALAASSFVAELLELAMPMEMPDEEMFKEVLWFATKLEGDIQPVKWLVAAQIRLLWRLGWMPRLLACCICGEVIESEEVAFAPSVGGSLCGNCWSKKSLSDAQFFPYSVLQAIYSLWHQPLLMETLHMRFYLWHRALELLRNHWRYHLEVDLKSWRVWVQLNSLHLPISPLKPSQL
ncbi:MAG: DNA repair protein RecO [Armatimonadetes bacterium]|nr:DNA repair protein RecO [Armatimonadota bacterium]MDW8027368.1 DNA repair protein RecO [Armatimonadota bacterium]